MDKKEFAMISMALESYFPNADLFPNAQVKELWFNNLKDISYMDCQTIINEWVVNNSRCPTIADIRGLYSDSDTSSGDGWEEVLMAIRKYGLYDIEGALESMTPITRKAVQQIGFKEICMCEPGKLSIERAQFKKCFEEIQDREKKLNRLPEHLRIERERRMGIEKMD